MLTILLLTAFALGGILYTQTGHQLGKLALKAWEEEDNDTTTAFLLFPMAHLRGEVGSSGASSPVTWLSASTYKLAMAFLWPLKIAANAAMLTGVVGPAKVARSFRIIEAYEKRLKETRREQRLLAARTGDADVKLAMLKAMREELDNEIIDAEAELSVERDSRIAALREAREEAEHEIARIEAFRETEAWCRGELPEATTEGCRDDTDDPDHPVPAITARVDVDDRSLSPAQRRFIGEDEEDEVPASTRRPKTDAAAPVMALAAKA